MGFCLAIWVYAGVILYSVPFFFLNRRLSKPSEHVGSTYLDLLAVCFLGGFRQDLGKTWELCGH